MLEAKLICKTCAADAVMLCCCDTARSKFCKTCLPDHLMSATEKAHIVLPLQAFPFIQTKKDEKKFLNYWRTEMKWKELYFEDEEYKP